MAHQRRDDVTGSVTIPDYPADKEQPTITVDDETQLPDGNTPGKTEVDVTVKYPDGTEDHINRTCNGRNRYSSTRCTNSGCPRSRSRYSNWNRK